MIYIFRLLFISIVLIDNKDYVLSTSYKVDVTIHYELICPHSRTIILEQAIPAWRRLSPIMNLELIPYGNTRTRIYNYSSIPPNMKFECQHGKRECDVNSLMVCILLFFYVVRHRYQSFIY